ncbi:hypothetical protein VQL36_05460 [Chengkuizengella sp. SCS-71B]|uniref:hypothetical protein n=1 Tax=Chengkuizengella sp. SCS-71B TaxID=3115290 RepID=UPI0032C23103
MGLNKGPFVVAQSFSVENPYGGEGSIELPFPDPDEVPVVVATVDVCVQQPQKTQVSIDSMTQIAVIGNPGLDSISFEVKYEILRNGTTIATINDEMDYAKPNSIEFRHTNFPNFPLVDEDPDPGINKYDLRCTFLSFFGVNSIFAGSRSLKATVITI